MLRVMWLFLLDDSLAYGWEIWFLESECTAKDNFKAFKEQLEWS